MESVNPATVPPLLVQFLLTVAMSFLLGLGLREYYQSNHKTGIFGTARTCTFIGMVGFVLFRLQAGGELYLGGLVLLGGLLALHYHYKLQAGQPGMMGLLMALTSYLIGPIAQDLPPWFLVLFTITALFVLNAKERIRLLTQKMPNGEIITLAQFLVLSGVILPLTPREPIASFIPVSTHQTWLAVVVVSGISYLGYVIQRYFLPGRGFLLSAAIGGVYSSTGSTILIARQSRHYPPASTEPAAGIIMATAVMYLRLLVIIAIFSPALSMSVLPVFAGCAALAGLMAYLLHRNQSAIDDLPVPNGPANPLELSTALLFASLFVVLSAATHFILQNYAHRGLHWMSFVAGFADIDPFVLSLLQGSFAAPQWVLAKALIIATASNNLLKAVYTVALGERRTARLAGGALFILAVLTLAYGLATP